VILSRKKCGTCPTRSACSTCPSNCPTCSPPNVCNLSLTKADIENAFKSEVASSGPDQTLPYNLTVKEVLDALNNGKVVLPQDISSLSPAQLAGLTPAELFITSIGSALVIQKVGFTMEQLAALTAEKISGLAPFQILMTMSNIGGNQEMLSQPQKSAVQTLIQSL
jgi:hypothetical protein